MKRCALSRGHVRSRRSSAWPADLWRLGAGSGSGLARGRSSRRPRRQGRAPDAGRAGEGRSVRRADLGRVPERADCTGTRSGRTRTPAAASRSARATCATSARTTCWTFAAASRSPATSAWKRNSSRRSCSGGAAAVGARRLARGDGGQFLRTRSDHEARRDLVNYGFTQPYLAADLEVFPTKKLFTVTGGVEVSQWNQGAGSGSSPSIEQKYTPATLPGLGASPIYLHTQATVGFDSRPARGYTRRGGFYGVTVHDYTDHDGAFGFNQVDYTAIQHIPILREAWVLAFRAFAQTTYDKSGQQIPFFMMPSFSGGSDLRAYSSWRLRDLNSLLLQGEWRATVNRFLEMALFYDAGNVARHAQRSGPARHEERLRDRLPLPRIDCDAAADRAGEGQRRLRAELLGVTGVLPTAPCGPPTRTASCPRCWPRRSWRPPGSHRRPHHRDLVAEFGQSWYARVDAAASREEKATLSKLTPDQVTATSLAGETITAKLTNAPGNNAVHRRAQGHHAQRVVRRPAVRHRGRLQDLRRVVRVRRAPGAGAGGGEGRGLGSPGRLAHPRAGGPGVTTPLGASLIWGCAHQVLVVGVPAEPRLDVRAERDDVPAARPHRVEGALHQRRRDALALELRVHLGVREHDRACRWCRTPRSRGAHRRGRAPRTGARRGRR